MCMSIILSEATLNIPDRSSVINKQSNLMKRFVLHSVNKSCHPGNKIETICSANGWVWNTMTFATSWQNTLSMWEIKVLWPLIADVFEYWATMAICCLIMFSPRVRLDVFLIYMYVTSVPQLGEPAPTVKATMNLSRKSVYSTNQDHIQPRLNNGTPSGTKVVTNLLLKCDLLSWLGKMAKSLFNMLFLFFSFIFLINGHVR